MNRSWVRFPQAAQMRPPGSGWAFLYALTGRAAWCARGRPARPWCCVLLLVAHRCCGCRRALPWGGAALCARGRWPAREIATREPAARSGRSRSPARPRHRPRAPQPGPPIPSAPRLEARPGPPDPPAPSTSVVPGVLMGGSVRRLEARNFNDYMSKREVCAGECLRICAEQALPPSEQFRT